VTRPAPALGLPAPAPRRRALLAAALALAFAALATAAAPAARAAVAWRVDPLADTTVAPGGELAYHVQMTNVGDSAVEAAAAPVTFKATLAPGLTLVSIANPLEAVLPPPFRPLIRWDCSAAAPGASSFSCTNTAPGVNLQTLDRLTLTVLVRAGVGAAGTLLSRFTVSGGDPASGDPASPATTVGDPTRVAPARPPFGLDAFDGQVDADAAGDPLTQAGAHPYDITTAIYFNTYANPDPLKGDAWPVAPAKDVLVDLPPGLVGNPTGVAQCTPAQLANGEGTGVRPLCPPTSQIGVTYLRTLPGIIGAPETNTIVGPLPVFNMPPPPGVPARFAFNAAGNIVTLDAHVRAGGDYGLSVDATGIPEGLAVAGTTLTFWGVPADPSHDAQRACPGQEPPDGSGAPTCKSGAPLVPFLRNPTACTPAGTGLTTTLRTDSWAEPGVFAERSFTSHLPPGYPYTPSEWGPAIGPTGCDKVPFDPTIEAKPASAQAGQPAPFTVGITMPQSDDPSTIGEGDLRNVKMTFPQGVRISPSSASGLGACTNTQIGLLGTGFPEPNPIRFSEGDPACPDSSKLGTVKVETPLLKEPLTGSVYLAQPHENPFGSLVALYLVAKGSGVTIKLPGKVELNPATGQMTTVFTDNPQLPFSHLEVALKPGPRAALVTPDHCGTYTTTAELTSWSGKTVDTSSSFQITEGAGGGACPAGEPFAPSFTGGTTNPVAGQFSPLTLRIQRPDGQQRLGSILSLTLPPGALADAASVPVRCSEAQADAAACPAASRIGGVQVGSGAGPNPFYVPGDVYFMGVLHSGPFKGDPFGLAVVVHALAGPFDLGYVVVKTGIRLNDDGSITARSEPFPQLLQGIPLDLRDIQINLDRPGFTFNPTDCNPLQLGGVLGSAEGLTANVSSRFQVGECAALKFKPSFTATTAANGTFNRNGASLRVDIAAPGQGPGVPLGKREAAIAKVETQLPKVLPARLTTLQKACTEKQFAANPAGCPPESAIGTAVAHTPVLSAPLEGPAYLVSHGGAAFPDLVLVLQGEGIVLHLTGHTQIKNGITYSRFQTVPDAPISSFELVLPERSYSALAAIGPLCGHDVKSHGQVKRVLPNLAMPTQITAQDGVVEELRPSVKVAGCKKAKTARHARTAGKRHRRTHR
jgi:hypothetical protein